MNLLPYHRGGVAKFERLGKKDPMQETSPFREKKIDIIKNKFEKTGLTIKIGG